MTFTAAGGQTAGTTDFGCTLFEPALKPELKSFIVYNHMCIWIVPHSINEQKSKIPTTRIADFAYFFKCGTSFHHERFILYVRPKSVRPTVSFADFFFNYPIKCHAISCQNYFLFHQDSSNNNVAISVSKKTISKKHLVHTLYIII